MSTEDDSIHAPRSEEATLWGMFRGMIQDLARLIARVETLETDTKSLKHKVDGFDDRLDEFHLKMTSQLGAISEKQSEMGEAVDSIKTTVEALSPIQTFTPTLAALAAREETRARETAQHRQENAELRSQIKHGVVSMVLAGAASLLGNVGAIPEQFRIGLVILAIVAIGAIMSGATLKRYFGGAR